jgi:hypothetical protein
MYLNVFRTVVAVVEKLHAEYAILLPLAEPSGVPPTIFSY